MNNLDLRRRATDSGTPSANNALAETVRQGILLRHASTTVAAIEYLTARGIDAATIRRVMRGDSLRETDRSALDFQRQTLERVSRR